VQSVENSKSQSEFSTLCTALGNPAKNLPDFHIPTAPATAVLSLSNPSGGAALLSPQQGRHLSSPLLTQTLQPDRGDTMYPSNPTLYPRLTWTDDEG
jgi:hypothetical protein